MDGLGLDAHVTNQTASVLEARLVFSMKKKTQDSEQTPSRPFSDFVLHVLLATPIIAAVVLRMRVVDPKFRAKQPGDL